MDKRKSYYLVIDTETTPFNKSITEVDPENMLVYDIGFAVVDKLGNIYKTFSYVVAETWINEHKLMQSRYYAEKLPQYRADLKNGTRQLASIMTIKNVIAETCKKWNIKAIVAHNMRFDLNALNRSIRYITKSKVRYFFPYGVEIWDSLKMARSTLGKQKGYKEWCKRYGKMTKNNQPQFKAETLYIYLTHNENFIERHTALADVLIESKIFSYCHTRHTKGIKRRLYA